MPSLSSRRYLKSTTLRLGNHWASTLQRGHNQLLFWDHCIHSIQEMSLRQNQSTSPDPRLELVFGQALEALAHGHPPPENCSVHFTILKCKMHHFREFGFDDKFVRNTWQILARAPLVRGVWDIFLFWLCFLWNPRDCTIVPSSCTRHRRSCCQELRERVRDTKYVLGYKIETMLRWRFRTTQNTRILTYGF